MSLRDVAELAQACRGAIERVLGGESWKRATRRAFSFSSSSIDEILAKQLIIECSRSENPALVSPSLDLKGTQNGLLLDARLLKVLCGG